MFIRALGFALSKKSAIQLETHGSPEPGRMTLSLEKEAGRYPGQGGENF
jgi:hypothetical protein